MHLTLTYAQSIDAKLAKRGSPLALSSPESFLFTHKLRASHAGILVGIETVLVDDPQLNTRLLEGHGRENPPIPIILDTRLRMPTTSKLLKNAREGKGKTPWIVTSSIDTDAIEKLRGAGAQIVRVADTRDLSSVLSCLSEKGIGSLMVEGGAQIIQSFLRSGLVDELIVTIAPTFVGGGEEETVGYDAPALQNTGLVHVDTRLSGVDTIVTFRRPGALTSHAVI